MSSPLEIPTPSFGEAIRFLRRCAELSQDAVAEKSSLHVTHISELEQGRGNPTHRTIDGLAKAFDVPPAYIFTLEDIFERKRNRNKKS
jgi:transcriptional regulator with XRE-family HTH domain